ncbi:hypothetical protein X802_07150 [Thermococcus guaymasensis DSM 11113]|uniref:DUF112 domain-containing protein n=1 Tax=Thermococcus guaymasensis DSM 11113 TaxID=1432656 RepID=A0A0X1KL29_9EURY|nr:tripartite tricarboxylate transporter permease [Thermococcus guaymasensis]AJC71957.1 hypothetical protein X802_07150 [Thermococcus guaymasensis DSM 11113]
MLWELLIGILLGTFTGLTPGIHVNTLAEMGGSFALLFAMGLTHTFLDVFPSTFLGVPDEGTALSILPAHRLVLAGKGLEVIRIALISSFLSVVFVIPLLPFYYLLAPMYSPTLGKIGVAFLLFFLILTERGSRLRAVLVILLSGALGWVVLFHTALKEPFYHVFTGLFGIPVVLASLGSSPTLPKQETDLRVDWSLLVPFSMLGTALGMVSSLLPAFTASMGATIATLFSRDERGFLAAVYSINTSNFLFGIFNFCLTGRTRNGIAVALNNSGVAIPSRGVVILSALLVASLAVFEGEAITKPYLKILTTLNYRAMNLAVIVFLFALSLYFDGFYGLWVLLTASIIGYLAQEWRVRRTNCMGVLMLPLLIM